MVKKLTAALVTIAREVKTAGIVSVNAIPQVETSPGMLEKLDKMQGIQKSRMSIGQREEALFQQWPGGVVTSELSCHMYPTS